MNTTNACVVMTTAPSKDVAETIATAVLTARLAACVQIQSIESHYWWDGKINRGPEHLLMFKTTRDHYAALEQTILKDHPYDTPEIIQLPVEAGLPKYLEWVERETASKR